jgi:pimeloyl-CoA synthetase
MKKITDSVVEERRDQYNEVMKRWIDLGKKDGIADVTTSTDLHVRDVLLINRINLSRRVEYTDWCSELPQGDENSYCHGYIIGVQEGWAKIEGLVTGRSEAPISEITPEAPPPYPPIPKKS